MDVILLFCISKSLASRLNMMKLQHHTFKHTFQNYSTFNTSVTLPKIVLKTSFYDSISSFNINVIGLEKPFLKIQTPHRFLALGDPNLSVS